MIKWKSSKIEEYSYTISKVMNMNTIEFLKDTVIAHRGVYDNILVAENSLTAFKLAIKKRYTIELDVHLLKDNKLVVFHDNTLERAIGIKKVLRDCTYEEIKGIKIFGTQDTIPTLEEVLTLVDGKVGLLIELKQDNKVGKLEKELCKRLEKYRGSFALQSFHPLTVAYFRFYKPNWIRGQLLTNFLKDKCNTIYQWILTLLLKNPLTKPDFFSCQLSLLPNLEVQEVRKKN